jgi:pimeloyl-ACP methyl ester carboxylesterase
MTEMVADYAGIVEGLGEENAIVVGHDWGAPMAYHCALMRPDRFRAVAGMSVPYTGRSAAPPLETMAKMFADSFFYIDYFQNVGVAEKELEADPRRSLKLILYSASGDAPPAPGFAGKPKNSGLLDGMNEPATLPSWLTEADVDFYGNEFKRSGFRGGINRYRNMDRDWHELAHLEGAHIKQPSTFIAGAKDGVIAMNPASIETMKSMCDDLRGVTLIDGAGHWNQQERPAETNAALLSFVKGL